MSASVPDQALAVPAEPASGLGPSGFDPSRFYDVRLEAIRITKLLRRADKGDAAYRWLTQWGTGSGTIGEYAEISYKAGSGSDWPNAEEATGYIEAAIRSALPQIVADAKRVAYEDMAALAQAIEARSGETETGSTEGESADPQGCAQGTEANPLASSTASTNTRPGGAVASSRKGDVR